MTFTEFAPDGAFCQLYQVIFPEVSDKNGIFGNKAKWYCIEQEDRKIIAFCTVGVIDNHKIFIYNVGVDPAHREKGYGKQLMDYMINLYNRHDIYLFVKKNNHKAIRLYQKCQFNIARRVFVPPQDEICMMRTHMSS
jgi:ribosomal protein S18 acetylase RimI-like enzyme